ncbi:hypothetical protein KKG72_09970 [bacterium]|nr:hypothetical protein [bacterium]MBU1995357.1 hypothetical protein [bacterium]
MKNAGQIINSLQSKPQFSKLTKYKCINKIQSLFIPALQKMIKFAYVKNDILFFVLNHPAGKQEFDNSIQSIKSALKFYMPEDCEETTFSDIKAFVTHTFIKVSVKTDIKKAKYPERASGNFAINIKDEKLNTLVRSIQDIIKAKNDTRTND